MDTDKTKPGSLFSIRVWLRLSATRQISAFFCNLLLTGEWWLIKIPSRLGSMEIFQFFGGEALFLEGGQLVTIAVVLAGEAGFVAMEGADGGSAGVEVFHGVVGAGRHGATGEFGSCFGLFFDLVGEAYGGHAPDADLTPFADDHFLDHEQFAFGAGLEFGDLAGEEAVEGFGGFAGDEDGVGQEAVADVGLGGAFFAFRGDGTAGDGAVGAGGFDLCFGALFVHLDREFKTVGGKREVGRRGV
jgi:hypothetical protein